MPIRAKYKHLYPKYASGGAVAAVAPEAPAPEYAHIDAVNADSLTAYVENEVRPAEPEPAQAEPKAELVLPDLAKDWLAAHPEYVQDPAANAKAQELHYQLANEGYEPYSVSYFRQMDRRLGHKDALQRILEEARGKAASAPADDDDTGSYDTGNSRIVVSEPSPRAIYSAPPTRSVPTSEGNGSRYGESRITLTTEQKTHARIAGISEGEYARNLLRLNEEKRQGRYGGEP
jgi:hypothetical protein